MLERMHETNEAVEINRLVLIRADVGSGESGLLLGTLEAHAALRQCDAQLFHGESATLVFVRHGEESAQLAVAVLRLRDAVRSSQRRLDFDVGRFVACVCSALN